MIDKIKLRRAVLKLRAVDHPIRKRMMEYLSENGSATPTELYLHIRELQQSAISQHMAVLRRQNIVKWNRNGHNIEYSLNLNTLYTISKASKGLAEGYHQYETA